MKRQIATLALAGAFALGLASCEGRMGEDRDERELGEEGLVEGEEGAIEENVEEPFEDD